MIQLIFITFTILFSIPSGAQEMMSGLIPPKFQKVTLGYVGVFHENAEFPTGDATTSFQAFDLSGPVLRNEQESWTASISGNELAVNPTQGTLSRFYDLKFGMGYTKALDDKRLWSASVRYGSASDRLFANPSVSTIGATWFYSYPVDETARWLYLVDYSNNRPILNNIPLPGFAYFYTPSKTFKLVVGVPFASVNWEFHERWGLEGFTLLPWIIKGHVFYKLNDHAKVYAGLDFSQVTYYRAERANNEERVFYDEKRLFLGVKSPISRHLLADLELGHAFDRAFFEAEDYEIDPENPTTFANAYYGKVSLRLYF